MGHLVLTGYQIQYCIRVLVGGLLIVSGTEAVGGSWDAHCTYCHCLDNPHIWVRRRKDEEGEDRAGGWMCWQGGAQPQARLPPWPERRQGLLEYTNTWE